MRLNLAVLENKDEEKRGSPDSNYEEDFEEDNYQDSQREHTEKSSSRDLQQSARSANIGTLDLTKANKEEEPTTVVPPMIGLPPALSIPSKLAIPSPEAKLEESSGADTGEDTEETKVGDDQTKAENPTKSKYRAIASEIIDDFIYLGSDMVA